MEIDDVDYVDELLRGMESKLGATVPLCLLQPIRTAAANSAGSGAGMDMAPAPPSPPLDIARRRSQGEETGDSAGGGGPAPAAGASTCCSTPRAGRAAPPGPGGAAGADVGGAARGRSGGTSTAGDRDAAEPPPLSPIGRRFNTGRIRQLEDNCSRLKDDMSALRAIDVGLMKQFLTLYDAVEELRWMLESAFDMSDSCESLSSSVSESIEQIHEKWMSERRQWQSTSSQNLANWREDSRLNLSHVGRLNSTGGRRPDLTGLHHSPGRPGWRPLHTASSLTMNSSFPEFPPLRRVSDFERQRRSSVDHLPLVPKTDGGSSDGSQDATSPASPSSPSSPSYSPPSPRKRRRQGSSSRPRDTENSETIDPEYDDVSKARNTGKGKGAPTGAANQGHIRKPKFLYHSKSSPSFKTQLLGLQVTDTADI